MSLQAALADLLRSVARYLSPSDTSSPDRPQTSSSATDTTEAIRAMERTTQRALTEMKDMAISILQGRPTQSPNPSQAAPVTQTLSQPSYDDDSIPLSPGIQAVIERETEEEAHLRLLIQQRADSAQQLARQHELLEEMGISPSPPP